MSTQPDVQIDPGGKTRHRFPLVLDLSDVRISNERHPQLAFVSGRSGIGTHVEIKSREGPVAVLLISCLACRLSGNRVGA